MGRPPVTSEIDRHATCRNLVWEAAAARGEAVPGRYCVNRLGVVHSLDCPVYQGLECCLFDPRAEGETPELTDEKELDRLRTRLTRDYLRWPYWKRVELLRGAEAPAIVVHDLPDTIEPEFDDDTEPVKKVMKEEPEKPQEKTEELPGERYPGQRRSEDRRKTRRAGESPPPAEADGGFAAGILTEEDVAVPAEPALPESGPPVKDAPAKAKEKGQDQKKRSRRRRPGRRRGRGRGKGKKPGGGGQGKESS